MHYLGSFVLQDMLLSLYVSFRWTKYEIFREHDCMLYCDVLGCLLGTVYIMGLFVTVIIFSFICPHAVLPRRRRSFTSRKRYVCQETFYVSCTGGGVLLEKSGWGVRPTSQNPYPIHDQNLRFSLLYL